MGDWNFQFEPVCLPEELADPFYEEQFYGEETDIAEFVEIKNYNFYKNEQQ